jgi:hypothetical protein
MGTTAGGAGTAGVLQVLAPRCTAINARNLAPAHPLSLLHAPTVLTDRADAVLHMFITQQSSHFNTPPPPNTHYFTPPKHHTHTQPPQAGGGGAGEGRVAGAQRAGAAPRQRQGRDALGGAPRPYALGEGGGWEGRA